MIFRKTLADSFEGKTFYELFVKKSKDVRKLTYKIAPKGAILLKSEGDDYKEYARIAAGEKINIMNSKLKSIGNMDALQVNWKGKVGFIEINRILAPTMIGRLKNVFSKPVKQADDRVNQLNKHFKEDLQKVNSIRSSVSYKPLEGLNIKIKNKKLKKIAFAYDVPKTKDSIAEIALGLSSVDLDYWFGKAPEGLSLTDVFYKPDSFIYNDPYLKDVLNKVYNDYIDKENGVWKLQTTIYRILNGQDSREKTFFKKAISGPDGDKDESGGSKMNIEFFIAGDIDYKLVTPLYGDAVLSFKDGVIFKEDLVDLFNKKETCLVIENSTGVTSRINGKKIRNISVGLYKKEYVTRLRDAIKI